MAEVATKSAPEKAAPKRLIPVLNNRLGKIQISTSRGKDGSFTGAGMLDLNVGANLVPEDKWKIAKEQESIRFMLKEKIERTGAPEDQEAKIGSFVLEEGRPLDADNPFLDMTENEGLSFVNNTESLELLERLAKQDAPGQVLIAINRRIASIKDPKNAAAPGRN